MENCTLLCKRNFFLISFCMQSEPMQFLIFKFNTIDSLRFFRVQSIIIYFQLYQTYPKFLIDIFNRQLTFFLHPDHTRIFYCSRAPKLKFELKFHPLILVSLPRSTLGLVCISSAFMRMRISLIAHASPKQQLLRRYVGKWHRQTCTHTHTHNQVEAEMSNRYTRVGRGIEASCSWMQTSSHHRYVDYLSTSHTPLSSAPAISKIEAAGWALANRYWPPFRETSYPHPSLSRELTSALTIAISRVWWSIEIVLKQL